MEETPLQHSNSSLSKHNNHFTAGLGPPFLFASYQSHSPGLVLISLYTFPVWCCVISKDYN